MHFVQYTGIENIIFEGVKKYFESLPPLGSDDYENSFFDVVAQFGGNGESYLVVDEYYEDIASAEILLLLNKLSSIDKKAITEFYENNFLDNYLGREGEGYNYSDEDLAIEIAGRFKGWVEDNFNLDDMLEEYEENEENEEDDDDKEVEDKEVEDVQQNVQGGNVEEDEEVALVFKKSESADKIKFIGEVIDILLEKPFPDRKYRSLQIAKVYLSYHPLVPNDNYIFSIVFTYESFVFKIEYSYEMISLKQFYIEDGSIFYEYKFVLFQSGFQEEEGVDFERFIFLVEGVLRDKQINEIDIINDYL